ncbi:ABC-type transport auxiliary lipoprotein family protein [Comamonas sp. NoAH]|uniref:ABC-type transport auxiliary lipoprotein family protein n=1 Tax=Comamonas halotolerans TaxID=3041496 RepID=UPI0024E12367|nr:ABC-type transport auxiliary lipoprotein family protein [Comamonas sp. NoAH]
MHVRMDSWMMRLGCALAVVWLAGCSALPSRPAASVRYDLGLADVNPPAATASAPMVAPVPLVMAPVQALNMPEGMTAMLYRLNYADGQQLRAYQNARWSQPPAQMLEQRLRMRLGLERPLLSERDEISFRTPDNRMLAVLKIELNEFSHVFESVSSSYALVHVRASLIARDAQSGGNMLQGQRILTAQVPATSADAAGGAQAMAAAVDEVAGQLSRWLQTYGR